MKHYLPLIAVASVALLSACNKNDEPEVVGGPADPMAAQLANAAPVETENGKACAGDLRR